MRNRFVGVGLTAFSTLLAASGISACGDLELVNQGSGGAGGAGGGSTISSGGSGQGGEGLSFSTSSQGGSEAGTGGEGGSAGPACGDGVLDPGEVCDDGNGESGDGCTGTCDAIEVGFACPLPGQSCLSIQICGDSKIIGTETCDDGNATAGDGCSDGCLVEPGWKCPVVGTACVAFACGDSLVVGQEKCDDGNDLAGDGCSSTCQLEAGFKCDVPGMPCTPTVCGDGLKEGTELCDDGNNDMGDGCTPFCVNEPLCPAPGPCTTSCGDGFKLPGGTEQCDDGNTQDGDGCSANCMVEPGYDCVDLSSTSNQLALPIVLRDFKIAHPDFQYVVGNDLGIVQTMLGSDGKPVYAGNPTTPTTTGQANFDQWYRDVAGVNLTVLQTIVLNQLPNGTFQYNNSSFFPLDGLGWGNEGNGNNFHFTSEVRYWFEYQGGESLQFTGDDDVWVYVNKRLAVNLGGVHGAISGGVTLDAAAASTFGLVPGNIYEIVVFQAERHTTQSNYRLTLGDFDRVSSDCASLCGDGVKTPDEQCDDGVNDGSYGSCNADCTWGPYCGDGVVEPGEEQCDDGVNLSPYGGCAPGCVVGASCGDGQVDSLFGEQCDDGVNDGGYNECAVGCKLGPRCGDGAVQAEAGEQCDDGNKQSGDGCSASCKNETPA